MLMPDEQYLFGRVISADAVIKPMEGVLLLYIYRGRSQYMATPDRAELRPSQLLLPPIMTNRQGWNKGLFETIENVPLDACDALDQHCFVRWNGDYFDEYSNPLTGPVEPVGDYGLHSFRTIDDEISDALGFERVPD